MDSSCFDISWRRKILFTFPAKLATVRYLLQAIYMHPSYAVMLQIRGMKSLWVFIYFSLSFSNLKSLYNSDFLEQLLSIFLCETAFINVVAPEADP